MAGAKRPKNSQDCGVCLNTAETLKSGYHTLIDWTERSQDRKDYAIATIFKKGDTKRMRERQSPLNSSDCVRPPPSTQALIADESHRSQNIMQVGTPTSSSASDKSSAIKLNSILELDLH